MKKSIIIALFSLHLLVIVTGTRLFDFSRLPASMQEVAIFYLSICGGHPYSFFSPDIPAQYIVAADVTDSASVTRHVAMDRSIRTSELRMQAAIQLLCDNEDYEMLTDIGAKHYRSLYPTCRKMTVTVSKYLPPAPGSTADRQATIEVYKKNYLYE